MCYVTFGPGKTQRHPPSTQRIPRISVINERRLECQSQSRDQKLVANLWTEFAAQPSEALATNGKELQNPCFSSVAATFERANT